MPFVRSFARSLVPTLTMPTAATAAVTTAAAAAAAATTATTAFTTTHDDTAAAVANRLPGKVLGRVHHHDNEWR